jgi:hypothetical protein
MIANPDRVVAVCATCQRGIKRLERAWLVRPLGSHVDDAQTICTDCHDMKD